MSEKGYIYSDQIPMFGHKDIVGYGTKDFYVIEIPKQISKDIIIKNHYSHKVCNDATTHIHLGCYINGDLGILNCVFLSSLALRFIKMTTMLSCCNAAKITLMPYLYIILQKIQQGRCQYPSRTFGSKSIAL